MEIGIITRIEQRKMWVTIDRLSKDKHAYGPCLQLEGLRTYDPATGKALSTDGTKLTDGMHNLHVEGDGAHLHEEHTHYLAKLPYVVGDEVVVDFIGMGHQQPIILGRLVRP
jgi:hypothetical protein